MNRHVQRVEIVERHLKPRADTFTGLVRKGSSLQRRLDAGSFRPVRPVFAHKRAAWTAGFRPTAPGGILPDASRPARGACWIVQLHPRPHWRRTVQSRFPPAFGTQLS
jgi:hypothetical protein